MKESQSGTRYNVTAPFLVESYKAASNCYTSGGDISIASPIYKMEDGSEVSRIFPYGQIIRGDGGCYLNAALVGILNRCVNDQKKWQQFKENVIVNYKFAEDIINKIESKAINNSHDGAKNGLDRAKLNEILQEKGNDNLATQLSKKIITHLHQDWIKEYENKIELLEKKLSEEDITASVRSSYTHYINLNNNYKEFLMSAQENEFAAQYDEGVLVHITDKLIDKTGITTIYAIGEEMMSSINQDPNLARELGLLEGSIIYLLNPQGKHFNLCYGIKDPIIVELKKENDKETRKKEEKENSDDNKRKELLQNINTIIISQQQQQQQEQEGKAPDEQKKIENIQQIIKDILNETELGNATLAQLSLINDIYEANKAGDSESREAVKKATIQRTQQGALKVKKQMVTILHK
ncbi:MAG: hypothetical protein CMP18_02475 [Rickettsiales bacterium]|nr:hypothetical protein [Rickettsiales bacterium]